MPKIFENRLKKLQTSLFFQKTPEKWLFVDNFYDILYFTGIKASFAWLFVGKTEVFLVTDGRYAEKTHKQVKDLPLSVKIWPEEAQKWAKTVEKELFLPLSVSFQQKKTLEKTFSKAKCHFLEENPGKNLRRTKNKNEIDGHKRAMGFTETQLEKFWDFLQQKAHKNEPITEKAAAWHLETLLRAEGQHQLAFSPIVAFGKNTSLPHHAPSDAILELHQPILVDCGVILDDFCSDITRMGFWGVPSEPFLEAFKAVKHAHSLAKELLQPKMAYKSLSEAIRKDLGPFEPFFTHSLGHGVGLEVHEAPNVSQKAKEAAKIGDIITLEPGVYFPNAFGIRIEDMGAVSASGFESFCQSETDLIFL